MPFIGNMGAGEMIFVMVVLLLIFGAKRLPELGSGLGKGIREFKRSMTDIGKEIERSGDDNKEIRAAQRPAVAPPVESRETDNLKDVFFDFDKYDIRAADAKMLDSNAAWLKTNDNLVLIEGHCDERGTNEYNLALGERRAKATMNYLVGQGVQANRITIISYGKERPTCTEHSEACWAKNRRAHFLVKAR